MTPGARRDAREARRQLLGASRCLEMLAAMLRASGHVRCAEVEQDFGAVGGAIRRLTLMLEERTR